MENWIVQSKCVCGSRNATRGLECQDRAAVFQKNGCVAAALADGSGNTRFAAYGAQITARVLAQMLCEQFDNLYAAAKWDPLFLKHNVISNILRNQRENQPEVPLRQMQSTALAVAVDTNQNRYLYVHLGDGQIYCQKSGVTHCISEAENGFGANETYLTACKSAVDHLRYGVGGTRGMDAFLLASDGGQAHLEAALKIDDFFQKKQRTDYTDDIGICQIICCNPNLCNIFDESGETYEQ